MEHAMELCRPTDPEILKAFRLLREKYNLCVFYCVDSSVIALKEPSGFTERQGSLFRCRSCHAELLRARRAEPRLVLVLVFWRCTVAKARDMVGLRASVATD